jgi:hypothetical protein
MALASSHVGVIDSRYHKPEALKMRDRQLAIYIYRVLPGIWKKQKANTLHSMIEFLIAYDGHCNVDTNKKNKQRRLLSPEMSTIKVIKLS